MKREFRSSDSYETLLEQLKGLLESSYTDVANMANMASLFYWSIEDINWVGFYLAENGTLMLGPFHGKPACVTIEMGKGVCGTAALRRETMLVDDVDEFPGHIQCDAASRSELVVPIIKDGELYGVLDIDSPRESRFTRSEKELFEAAVRIFLAKIAR